MSKCTLITYSKNVSLFWLVEELNRFDIKLMMVIDICNVYVVCLNMMILTYMHRTLAYSKLMIQMNY